ncbi:hypothetical protein PPERSA_03994 [Pseudocohnilembus persalinus]|uniref:Uncharacterized protein n=1 Tax=Pseudocohnilembus persalinus TaxID=266149 RepID=A0A0V0QBU4_PSEPJ|nr:hypothetical protein PPERSA_03994 [Pseudocohnilembus persalinus]|eukprot:KRW99524.1 hypothetical protein PPERSA_03994 [Pseudocohnilembus persalinus]
MLYFLKKIIFQFFFSLDFSFNFQIILLDLLINLFNYNQVHLIMHKKFTNPKNPLNLLNLPLQILFQHIPLILPIQFHNNPTFPHKSPSHPLLRLNPHLTANNFIANISHLLAPHHTSKTSVPKQNIRTSLQNLPHQTPPPLRNQLPRRRSVQTNSQKHRLLRTQSQRSSHLQHRPYGSATAQHWNICHVTQLLLLYYLTPDAPYQTPFFGKNCCRRTVHDVTYLLFYAVLVILVIIYVKYIILVIYVVYVIYIILVIYVLIYVIILVI